MEFDWSRKTIGEWRKLLEKVPRSNCMQTWPFAKAVRVSDQKVTRMAVLQLRGQAVGIMAIQEVKLGPIHIVNLYRGPLWFELKPPLEWIQEFAKTFDKEFPKRLFRRRRWLPEWEGDHESLHVDEFRSKRQHYKTAWLDLSMPEDQLFAQLKRNWRNTLRRGKKSGLTIVADWTGKDLDLFIQKYDSDRLKKKYRGPRGLFIKEEFLAAKPFHEAFILWAYKQDQPAAAIFILMHGTSATYHFGWSEEIGRQNHAHNVLLWEAVCMLKERGIQYLDMGGLRQDVSDGFNRFKMGLGCKVFNTPGMLG